MNVLEHAAPQWNAATCGPAALRCALLCYGDRVNGRVLAELAGTDHEGTDEYGLDTAALAFGCEIEHWYTPDEGDAAKTLRELLERKIPVLLAVDHWEHWVCALPRARGVSLTNRYVWIADPARDGNSVVRRYTWRQLLRRIHWGLPDEIRFDLYAVELA